MKTNYILIDYENVQVKSLALLSGDQYRVFVFLGPKNTKLGTDLVLAMQQLGNRAEYVRLDASGHNALDFHITYYLGKLAAADVNGSFCIISKDTGFDSLIKHIKGNGVDCARAVSIEAMLGVKKLPVEKVKPVPKEKAAAQSKQNTEELAKKVVKNLIKRAAGKPRTEKTLRSTITTLCGKLYSEKEVDDVFNLLVKNGVVKIEGAKIVYVL